jgi:hypothetical protein
VREAIREGGAMTTVGELIHMLAKHPFDKEVVLVVADEEEVLKVADLNLFHGSTYESLILCDNRLVFRAGAVAQSASIVTCVQVYERNKARGTS